jgi:antitoxin (DNA-binding transcriptional repressor) of toxin-antitoxin stability system
MRTVNIGKLKNELSAYLQYVRNGEEVVVKDRNVAVARILPFDRSSVSDEEARLVAEGKLKLPKREMDWDEFFSLPTGNVSHDVAVRAALEGRGDR